MSLLRSTTARLVITAAILAYLLRSIDLGAAVHAMLRVNPWWFAFTLVLVAADRVLMAVRWLLLLRAADVDIPAASALRIFLRSSFVGSFLPAGVGADAARAYEIASRTSRGSQAVASVGIDRILGLVAIAILGIAGLAGWAQHVDPALRLRLMAVAAFGGLAVLAIFWVDRIARAFVPLRWHGTRWGWRILRLGDAIGAYRGHPKVLAQVMALSIAVQLVRVFQGYGLGRGLGIQVGLAYYLVFMPIDRDAGAAAAGVDQRLRAPAGRHRLAAPADGRAGRRVAGALDAPHRRRHHRQSPRGAALRGSEEAGNIAPTWPRPTP